MPQSVSAKHGAVIRYVWPAAAAAAAAANLRQLDTRMNEPSGKCVPSNWFPQVSCPCNAGSGLKKSTASLIPVGYQ